MQVKNAHEDTMKGYNIPLHFQDSIFSSQSSWDTCGLLRCLFEYLILISHALKNNAKNSWKITIRKLRKNENKVVGAFTNVSFIVYKLLLANINVVSLGSHKGSSSSFAEKVLIKVLTFKKMVELQYANLKITDKHTKHIRKNSSTSCI